MSGSLRVRALFLAALLVAAGCTSGGSDARSEGEDSKARPAGAHDVSCRDLDRYIARTRKGYVPVRSSDLSLVPHEPNYVGTPTDAVHTGPFDSLAEVPLVFYSSGNLQEPDPEVLGGYAPTLADVAPTIGRLVDFGFDTKDGSPLLPIAANDQPLPRLVVTVVWDGGGWNTLGAHPKAWPFLSSLLEKGVAFDRTTIGSTPSVTPPIHTTLGTGVFPRRHGIPHVKMTTAVGDYIDPFEGNSPIYVRAPTLADLYDRAGGNRPLAGVVATVNWHLGMIGHGALFDGGDRDVAVLLNSAGLPYGDPAIYDIPRSLVDPSALGAAQERLDGSDGTIDQKWRGHDLGNESVRYASPAFVEFQQEVLEQTIAERGFGRDEIPDLLFTNFKSIDDAAHHWGVTSPETREVIAATDLALRRMAGFLDRQVGSGGWVLAVTADHGSAKLPPESGGWAIRGHDLEADLNRAFDVPGPPVFERVNSAGIFVNEEQWERVDPAAVGRWLLAYTASDNLFEIDEIPGYYAGKEDVPLFDAVLDGRKVVARSCGGPNG